jgi:hypothetical protein
MTAARQLASAVLAVSLMHAPSADAQRLVAAVFLFEMDITGTHGATPGQASQKTVPRHLKWKQVYRACR